MHLVVCVTAKMIVIMLNYRQFTEVPEAWGILDGGDTDFFVGAPAWQGLSQRPSSAWSAALSSLIPCSSHLKHACAGKLGSERSISLLRGQGLRGPLFSSLMLQAPRVHLPSECPTMHIPQSPSAAFPCAYCSWLWNPDLLLADGRRRPSGTTLMPAVSVTICEGGGWRVEDRPPRQDCHHGEHWKWDQRERGKKKRTLNAMGWRVMRPRNSVLQSCC